MVFLVFVITFCAAWSVEGQMQTTYKNSVRPPSLDSDRWIWDHGETSTPLTLTTSSTTPRVSTVTAKNNTENNKNQTEVETAPRMKNESYLFQQMDFKLFQILKKNATLVEIMIADLCAPYNPPVPDFSAPGRRISDVKCQEYIWNIKYEIEKERRQSLCEDIKLFRDKTNVPAVEGGRLTKPGEFPHMGAIGWKGTNGEWQFKCGSSLISPKFVLTAAHCSRASESDTSLADPIPKIVRLSHKNIFIGLLTKNKLKFDINIINIIIHPDYKSPKKYYDIALMELERTVGFSQLVQPSCLWGHSDINKLGPIATITGWGVLSEGSLDISPELQAAVLDIIDSEKCAQYLQSWCNRNWCGLKEHQFCAGKLAGGVDACQGDSGSPLQVKIPLDIKTSYNMYYVIGVTSFGVGCAQPNLPGVYIRVSSFIDWIENIVWPQ